MKIRLQETRIDRFRNAIALMKTVNEEMTLTFTPTGIKAISMDPSHVSMVRVMIEAEAFDEYEVPWVKEPEGGKEGEGLLLTFDLAELDRRLKTIIPKEETLTLEYDETNAKLLIHIRNTITTRKRRFGINILEPLDEEVPEPKILFKAEGRIFMKDWERAIKDAEFVSEHIQLALLQEGNSTPQIHFSAAGDAGTSFLSADTISGKVEDEAKSTFTLSYLSDMVAPIKQLTDVIELSLTTEMPLKISLESNSIEAELFLAPCIGV